MAKGIKGFPKGYIPWNKGKKGLSWNSGTKVFLTKICISCGEKFTTPKQRNYKTCSQECRYKAITDKQKGRPFSEERKQSLRNAHPHLKGEKSPHWKGGIQFTYRSRHKERVAFWSRLHSYRKKNANGSHSLEEWEALKARYFWMCLCCKRHEPEIKLTEDHIIPLSKGGTNDIGNIQPLCLSCNSKKHTRIINYISDYAS